MKESFFKVGAMMVCMLIFMSFSCVKSNKGETEKEEVQEKEEQKYEVYENHDIFACGVDDPLQNIEWLCEYCRNIKEKIIEEKNIVSGAIWLYKVIEKDEYFFEISNYHHVSRAPLSAPVNCSVKYLNCNGETDYEVKNKEVSDPSISVPRPPDPWFVDKEFVEYLFHFFPIVIQ